jgi:hypothetical protein
MRCDACDGVRVPLIVDDGFLDLVGLKTGERLGAGKELPQQDAVAAVRPCRCSRVEVGRWGGSVDGG